jgi:hypothetical protein
MRAFTAVVAALAIAVVTLSEPCDTNTTLCQSLDINSYCGKSTDSKESYLDFFQAVYL